jgi:nucleoside-diphosphate-sugar epimerase
VFASSIAVYGEGLSGDSIGDDSLQRPTTIYGAGKVFGELQGRFYARRFGLDFRGLRVPSVVGPDSRVSHMSIYNCRAIEEPLRGRPYLVPVEPETRCPTIYYKDAARAFRMLGQADESRIKTRVYNIAGHRPTYSAAQLVDAVRRQVPGAELSFAPQSDISRLLQGIGRLDLDDTPARQEWGWKPAFDLEQMVADFAAEYRAHPDIHVP